MIESNLFGSSSWEYEPLDCFNIDLPFSEIPCIESLQCNCGLADYKSVALNDIFEEQDCLPVSDSFISQILEESNSLDNWPWLEEEVHSVPVENSLSSVRDSPKKRRKNSRIFRNKSWSKMSPEEQVSTLHTLSELVTRHMGIREQLDVIKIIDPSVTILPDDKEFALDISYLNDSKMKRIRDYVQKIGFSLSKSPKQLKSSSNDFVSEKPSSAYKLLSRKTNSRTKRRQRKQKRADEDVRKKRKLELHSQKEVQSGLFVYEKKQKLADEDVRKMRKLELHGQKEVQSGLFVYEKVIKLSNPLEEDEDVNILE